MNCGEPISFANVLCLFPNCFKRDIFSHYKVIHMSIRESLKRIKKKMKIDFNILKALNSSRNINN